MFELCEIEHARSEPFGSIVRSKFDTPDLNRRAAHVSNLAFILRIVFKLKPYTNASVTQFLHVSTVMFKELIMSFYNIFFQ